MRIGELARQSGCDVETLRFYEKEQLLDLPGREANGYRRYTDAHLAQLRFIRHCRSLGISLADIRRLRQFQAHPELACDDINTLIDEQIVRIHQQVETLLQLEKQLHALRDSCLASQNAGECNILRNLEQATEDEACSCHHSG
jgi:Cd(II)/Pb(II)-responsive transcriptional regulator